ncbi:MAG TPA: hypothetical protein VGN84_10010 [Solirubrobacterales bacterium]|nr:hypothetical protein [Solirubrobacterales bacterium]
MIIVAFVALAAFLQLLRLGPSNALNSLWAEDGMTFLGEALNQDFLHLVTVTHGEYLVVLPRLIGEVGAAVPLYHAPMAMNLIAVLVIALGGLAVWFASAGQIHSPYLRALLVALMVLCPVSTVEGVATPTNVAWYAAFAVFWLLLWRPATIWGACLGALLILVTGLSTPATFFFLPIALLRAIAIRNRRDTLIVGAYALATALQVQAITHSNEHVAVPIWTGHIITAFLQRVVDSSVLGLELGGSTWAAWGWPFLVAIVVTAIACLIAMLLRTSSSRLFAAIAVGTSVTMFMVSAYNRAPLGDLMVWPTGGNNTLGSRYAIIPTLLLISAGLALLDSVRPLWRGRPLATIAAATVLLVSLVTSFDVRVDDTGRGGPLWDESLHAATAQCYSEGLAAVPVPTAPEGWTVSIPCDRLVSTVKPVR